MRTTESEKSQRTVQKPGRRSSGKAAQPAAAKPEAKKRLRRISLKSLHGKVLGLITEAYNALKAKEQSLSIADLTKLMQLEKELRPQSYQRMVVEWVDRKREGE